MNDHNNTIRLGINPSTLCTKQSLCKEETRTLIDTLRYLTKYGWIILDRFYGKKPEDFWAAQIWQGRIDGHHWHCYQLDVLIKKNPETIVPFSSGEIRDLLRHLIYFSGHKKIIFDEIRNQNMEGVLQNQNWESIDAELTEHFQKLDTLIKSVEQLWVSEISQEVYDRLRNTYPELDNDGLGHVLRMVKETHFPSTA